MEVTKPASPTSMVIDFANSPEGTNSGTKSSLSPVKFADLNARKQRKDIVKDDNQSQSNTTAAGTSSSPTANMPDNAPKPRRRKKNVSRSDDYKPAKRYRTDPTKLGNIKGKLRMLNDSRNLRFRKLYKPPNPYVVWIFIGMVVTWYSLFNYFGPSSHQTIYKPSTATFNPASEINLKAREPKEMSTAP
jgi:hypothetical protein